jgi:hypothetical protein
MDYSRFWILLICAVQAAIVAAVISWVALTGSGDAPAAGAQAEQTAGQESVPTDLSQDGKDVVDPGEGSTSRQGDNDVAGGQPNSSDGAGVSDRDY